MMVITAMRAEDKTNVVRYLVTDELVMTIKGISPSATQSGQ